MTRLAASGLLLCAALAACMKAPDPAGMGGGAAPAPAAAVAAPRVELAAPEGWTAIAVDQSFYLAKWEVVGGGVATLSWLGAGGGDEFIASNVQRWLGEWQQPDGTALTEYAFDTLEHGGRKVHRLRLDGTLSATRQFGGGDPRTGWSLFGAVIESEAGPVFFKFLGPVELIAEQEAAAWSALAGLQIRQAE